jgi:hypothetical protein
MSMLSLPVGETFHRLIEVHFAVRTTPAQRPRPIHCTQGGRLAKRHVASRAWGALHDPDHYNDPSKPEAEKNEAEPNQMGEFEGGAAEDHPTNHPPRLPIASRHQIVPYRHIGSSYPNRATGATP